MKAGCLGLIVIVLLFWIIGSCANNSGGSSSNPCREAGFTASDCAKGTKILQQMK